MCSAALNIFFYLMCVIRLFPIINMQILEVVRLEGQTLTHDEGLLSRDIHLLQVIIIICFVGFLRAVLLPVCYKLVLT
jgi:hypothetical protein